ncbi:hypothetical protein AA313_de0201367 [Arthrobotrys entomopaga]|nr:hypothetical protein AA313_de0201367 [Arthrobotrys entomopaga]
MPTRKLAVTLRHIQIMILNLNSTDLINLDLELPDIETMKKNLKCLYQIIFAAFMGRYHPQVLSPTTPANEKIVAGIFIERVGRVFMSTPIFMVSTIVLLVYLISAITIYNFHKEASLQRRPTSLASLIAYFYASEMLLPTSKKLIHDD